MPNNTFDASQMKLRLDEYISETLDTLTTNETVEKYAAFLYSLYELQGLTKKYYTPDENGDFPVLGAGDRESLSAAYRNAMQLAQGVYEGGETGRVGEKMRSIAGELIPLMMLDCSSLETAAEPMPLPELIAKTRAQAVDMGDQEADIAAGQLSSRQHIKITDGRTVEEGYFTASSTVHLEEDKNEAFRALEAKYPPAYKPVLDAVKSKSLAEIAAINWKIYGGIENPEVLPPDAVKREVNRYLNEDVWPSAGVRNKDKNAVSGRADFYAFVDDLASAMDELSGNYSMYRGGNAVSFEDGTNIDKRNIAMYRMGRLFGKPDLVCEARPMTLIQNGKPVTGTFMKRAYGTDLLHTRPGDPILGFGERNLNNPAAFSDIAAMQALDFICGNVDRHVGNMILHFDPPSGDKARLTGVSLIDNDLSFSHADGTAEMGSKFVLPKQMGVIGQSFYDHMKAMTKEQMQLALADCGISAAEIDFAWERKNMLQKKIEDDMNFFKSKAPGAVYSGKIRVVPDDEWDKYNLRRLAETLPMSQFKAVFNAVAHAQLTVNGPGAEKIALENGIKDIKQKLGVPVPAPQAPQPEKEVPVGITAGSGIAHEADPLNAGREETVHLVIADMASVKTVGSRQNTRYALSYKDTDGSEKQVFLTLPNELSPAALFEAQTDREIAAVPKYKKPLEDIKKYYSFTEKNELLTFPTIVNALPYEKLNWTKKQFEELKNDKRFCDIINRLSTNVLNAGIRSMDLTEFGMAAGQRIELRNVAMSDIGDVLGVPGLLARSTTAKIMCGGHITDAIVMEKAEGFDVASAAPGSPMAMITAEQAGKVYNDPRGLRSLADIAVLDYVCLNVDRHSGNMMYQFEGMDTDEPKFVGVQGIDNDYSFGTGGADSLPMPKAVTEAMAKKLAEPALMESIAEKMRKNGLNAQQTEAARVRLEAIRSSIKAGTTRVVKDAEWGKGDNSWEELAKAEGSIFGTLKRDVIDYMAQKAEQWNARPENERVYNAPEPLAFTKAVKVGSFGMNATEQEELDKLTKEAAKEFRERINTNMRTAKADDSLSMRDYLRELRDSTQAMYDRLKAADPFFHGTSAEYKNCKKAVKHLKELSSKLVKNLEGGRGFFRSDAQDIVNVFGQVSKSISVYNTKKKAELAKRGSLSVVGEARLDAGRDGAAEAARLRRGFVKSLSRTIAEKSSPTALVQERINEIQNYIHNDSGAKLRKAAAQLIYFKGLESSSVSLKNSSKLRDAHNQDVIDAGVAQIMESPAFGELTKLPEKELISLAQEGDGSRLMDSYFRTAAKVKHTEAAKEAARHQAAAVKAKEGPKK